MITNNQEKIYNKKFKKLHTNVRLLLFDVFQSAWIQAI